MYIYICMYVHTHVCVCARGREGDGSRESARVRWVMGKWGDEWLQGTRVHCSVLQSVVGRCSVLQCVAACCSVLQCVAARGVMSVCGVRMCDTTHSYVTWFVCKWHVSFIRVMILSRVTSFEFVCGVLVCGVLVCGVHTRDRIDSYVILCHLRTTHVISDRPHLLEMWYMAYMN